MTRWKYSFRTRKVAKKFLDEANRETSEKYIIKKVNSDVGVYRIVKSKEESKRRARRRR